MRRIGKSLLLRWACDAIDKKLVGPSYKEVAVKYAGDSAALAKLEQKVRNGRSGACP